MTKLTKLFIIISLVITSVLTGCSSPKQDSDLRHSCPTIKSQVDYNAEGVLLLDDVSSPFIYLKGVGNIKVDKKHEVEGFDFSVSPNGKWIAYYSYRSDDLIVTDADLQEVIFLKREKNWGNKLWLDDNNLIINIIENNPPVLRNLGFLILNPFDNEKQEVKMDYPNIYNGYPLPFWNGFPITAFNSRLDRVVYLQGDTTFFYTLWDTENQKIITQMQVYGEFQSVPYWVLDGSMFAVAPSLTANGGDNYPSYEIFIVSHDGIIKELTHLSDYYRWVYISDLSWSPNNQYIAFWYSYWNDTDVQPYFTDPRDRYLGVVNAINGETTVYCIHGELNREIGMRVYQPPLWSPNSRQVIIQSQVGEDYPNYQTILVDVQEDTAYYIADNLEPVGWMTSP
ncbi:MAG: PD40 domain-containing protein [Chloroflexi bacterium]|nr:PD40 domain-containing protein [Chloroflexota bacterium]